MYRLIKQAGGDNKSNSCHYDTEEVEKKELRQSLDKIEFERTKGLNDGCPATTNLECWKRP